MLFNICIIYIHTVLTLHFIIVNSLEHTFRRLLYYVKSCTVFQRLFYFILKKIWSHLNGNGYLNISMPYTFLLLRRNIHTVVRAVLASGFGSIKYLTHNFPFLRMVGYWLKIICKLIK